MPIAITKNPAMAVKMRSRWSGSSTARLLVSQV